MGGTIQTLQIGNGGRRRAKPGVTPEANSCCFWSVPEYFLIMCPSRSVFLCAVATFLAATSPLSSAAEAGWVNLINGKDLDNWAQRGGKAHFALEGDTIVGRPVLNTENSFLCTKRQYANFILEADFNVDPQLNAGIQFRSQCFDHETIPHVKDEHGKEIVLPANRVHGYKCEIDMEPARGRWWSAGLYDEGRRGWLYPGMLGGDTGEFTGQGASTSKPNVWNHLRIEADGGSIKTFLNGEARASIIDDLTPSGFIALQVHGIGDDQQIAGLKVSFRNIRVRELASGALPPGAGGGSPNTLSEQEKLDGWRMLWDGKSTAGWRGTRSDKFPATGWVIQDGTLSTVGSSGAGSAGGGDIVTEQSYKDFELSADFRITPGANSGIKYYVDPDLGKDAGSALGLEYQIIDNFGHPDADAGQAGNRTTASLYDLVPAVIGDKISPVGGWNTARIVARGSNVEHCLNGEKVLEYERGTPAFRALVSMSKYAKWEYFGELPEGPILLQDHGDAVSFRNLKIRPLPVP